MSLNRIVARMAVVSALTNFGRAPWPTVAGPLIYDSKIEPSEQLEGDYQRPIAVVYTDYDKDFMIFRNKLQAKRNMTITIELLVVQAPEAVLDEANEPTGIYTLETPTTDSELETTLDLFERQVFLAMQGDSLAGDCFNFLVIGYENVISRRGAAVTGGQRLSARQITIETDLLRDPKPGIVPAATRAFLDQAIADGGDYADRAETLLRIYEDPMGFDPIDNDRRIMGLSQKVSEAMGMPAKPRVLLPPTIRWLNPDGSPL